MRPNKIIIHCSASADYQHYDIDKIRVDHKSRGWSDVGYHLVIQPSGEVQVGRPLNIAGAHCEGENSTSIGICLIGSTKFKPEQLDALKYQIESIQMTLNIPKWAVYCHYEFKSAQKQGKTCPNIDKAKLLYWLATGDFNSMKEYV